MYVNTGGDYKYSDGKVLDVEGASSWTTKTVTTTIKNGYGLYCENQNNANSYITVEIIK